jgi:hypothetical protein
VTMSFCGSGPQPMPTVVEVICNDVFSTSFT